MSCRSGALVKYVKEKFHVQFAPSHVGDLASMWKNGLHRSELNDFFVCIQNAICAKNVVQDVKLDRGVIMLWDTVL